MKLFCHLCLKPCKDEAVKFGEKYFHLQCFVCKECGSQLTTSDFYTKNEHLYCQSDYRRLFGSKCKSCLEYIEGEVVTALGFVFHKNCFACSSCSKVLQPGNKVTFVRSNFLCTDCFDDDGPAQHKPELQTKLEEPPCTGNAVQAITNKVDRSDAPQLDYGKFYNVSYLDQNTSPIKKGSSINTSECSPRHYHRPENFSYTQVARDFIKPPKKESSILLDDLDSEIALITKSLKSATNGLIGIAPISNREPVRLSKLPDAHLKIKPDFPGESGLGYPDVCFEKKDEEKRSKNDIGDDDKDGNDDDDDDDKGNERDGVEGATGINRGFDELDPVTGLRRLRSNPASTIYDTLGMTRSFLLDVLKRDEPIDIYPYEDLKFSNFRLPFGVERSSVERHLSRDEFVKLFRMSQKDFYSLAEWRRNDMKKKLDLF